MSSDPKPQAWHALLKNYDQSENFGGHQTIYVDTVECWSPEHLNNFSVEVPLSLYMSEFQEASQFCQVKFLSAICSSYECKLYLQQ